MSSLIYLGKEKGAVIEQRYGEEIVDEEAFRRLQLLSAFKRYQSKELTLLAREQLLRMIRVLYFPDDESIINKFINEARDLDSYFWKIWPEFEGDKSLFVKMLEEAKLYKDGGAINLLVKLILDILKAQEEKRIYGALLKQADTTADNFSKVLGHRSRLPKKESRAIAEISSGLRVNSLERFFEKYEQSRFDELFLVLGDNVPIIFSDKEQLLTLIRLAREKSSKKISNEVFEKFLVLFESWYH